MLEKHLHFVKRRRRGCSVWQVILSLMLVLFAGGESLTDICLLQSDHILKGLLGFEWLPAVTAL